MKRVFCLVRQSKRSDGRGYCGGTNPGRVLGCLGLTGRCLFRPIALTKFIPVDRIMSNYQRSDVVDAKSNFHPTIRALPR